MQFFRIFLFLTNLRVRSLLLLSLGVLILVVLFLLLEPHSQVEEHPVVEAALAAGLQNGIRVSGEAEGVFVRI